jgi:hypothetical protein
VRIAVLGTGRVGAAWASRLPELGHEVAVGTRDPAASRARADEESAWLARLPADELKTFGDAAAWGELVVNATNGAASLAALDSAGADNLAGKVLVDTANPLDFSAGMPPTLFVKDTDSLGEQIQRAFPAARVVKTLNTVTAAVMMRPAELGEESTVFISGDDLDAKRTVTELLTALGHTDVLDLGDISTARGPEMYLALWVRLWGAIGSPMLNVRVVRLG